MRRLTTALLATILLTGCQAGDRYRVEFYRERETAPEKREEPRQPQRPPARRPSPHDWPK